MMNCVQADFESGIPQEPWEFHMCLPTVSSVWEQIIKLSLGTKYPEACRDFYWIMYVKALFLNSKMIT